MDVPKIQKHHCEKILGRQLSQMEKEMMHVQSQKSGNLNDTAYWGMKPTGGDIKQDYWEMEKVSKVIDPNKDYWGMEKDKQPP